MEKSEQNFIENILCSKTGSLLCNLFMLLLWLFLSGLPAYCQVAQEASVSGSPNPVGSGARALGMGGAFIAVADDATAASWNPGGLIQLEKPEVSIVGAYVHRLEDIEFGTNFEASGLKSVSLDDINYISMAHPFKFWHRNMIFSINYQHLIDFTKDVEYYFLPETSGVFQLDSDNKYQIEGSLSAIGFAFAVQMTPTFSFGLTLNVWDDWLGKNGWEKRNYEKNAGVWSPSSAWPFFPLPDFPMYSDYFRQDHYSFGGLNANFGILWNISGKLTIGAVYKTPFKARLDHFNRTIAYGYMVIGGFTFVTQPKATTTFSREEELEMPMSYGVGLAYRFSDTFTVSADIYRTEWQDFILRDGLGNETSPITGRAPDMSDIDPTIQVRLGVEYLFILTKGIVPLRAGIFYDPAPAEGSPDDYFGVSFGSGIAWGRVVFDMAYSIAMATMWGTRS